MQKKDRLMTAAQLAEFLQLRRQTVYDLAASGRIPSLRLARKALRFSLPEVLKAVAAKKKNTKK
jgi:excisionase family DNA binding protein